MAPKRKAGASKAADKSASKKVKSSAPPAPTVLETVQNALSGVSETIAKAVDVASELVIDDDSAKTPVPLEDAAEEIGVDVSALKRKGKKAGEAVKGKAAKVAADAEEVVEKKIKEKTGVDPKAVKKVAAKAGKAATKVEETIEAVQPEIEKVAKPVKKNAKKAAAQASATAEQVQETVNDPKNRKKAEDFMHAAE